MHCSAAVRRPRQERCRFWSGVDERLNIKNTDPVYGGFAGEFVRNSAQWSGAPQWGITRLFRIPLRTSSSSFAEIGHERNGSFFP